MPENITTVLNLPDADFGSGGFPSPSDNRAYILQGEGSDRDRKVSLGDLFDWLVGAKAMTSDSPQHRVGDIVFKIEETKGGKILTAYIMDGRTLSKPTVTGGLKADSIEGTNQGTGDTKYLVLGNTTVTGDLDAKGKAMLGNSMLVADPDGQTLESRVPLGFGDGYQAGKELVRTDKVKTETVEISGGGKTVSVTAAVSPASSSGKKAVFDSAVRMEEIDARYSYEITSATSYDLTSKWNGSQDENQGRMFMLYNQASAQCRVKISSTVAGDMFVPLNAGNIGAFIRVGWSEGSSIFAPVSFDRTVTVSEA